MQDYIEFKDYICLAHDLDIKKLISNEQIILSEKVNILYTFGIPVERDLIITNCALYNVGSKVIKKRIVINDIIGITVSTKSNQFVIHYHSLANDNIYDSNKRNEIISTIADVFHTITNNKLLFSIIEEESLRDYVTPKEKKSENLYFTLMKRNKDIFIEDVFKDKDIIEEKTQKMVEDELSKLDNENKMNDKLCSSDKKELYNDLSHISSKISNIGKFTTIGSLMAGGAATFFGVALHSFGLCTGVVQSIVTGVSVASAGIIGVALIPFLGFAAYSYNKNQNNKKIKQFYENLNNNNMKIEKEIVQHVINKIFNYFMKSISNNYFEIDNKINEINNHITGILTIFNSIDNSKLELIIDSIKKSNYNKDEQLILLDKNRKLVVRNYLKITQVLFQTIMSSTTSDINNSFDEGISLFKELLRCFGPQRVDNKNGKQIDYLIENIILIMKQILETKTKNYFDKFDPKIFKNSLEMYLKDKYREKQEQEEYLNENEEEFINKCKNNIIDLISSKSKNWGIASFYMFFINLIIKICLKSKEDNYKKMLEKLNNLE